MQFPRVLVASVISLFAFACGGGESEEAQDTQAVTEKGTAPVPSPPTTATGNGPTASAPTNVEPGALPAASEVAVSFAKLGTVTPLQGGDTKGGWVVDGARALLPSGIAKLIKLDKSGGKASAAFAVGTSKLKMAGKIDVTIAGILGAPQKINTTVDAIGTFTEKDGHLTIVWTGTGIELLPKEVDFGVQGDTGMLRWAEDLSGFGDATIEVDLHRAK